MYWNPLSRFSSSCFECDVHPCREPDDVQSMWGKTVAARPPTRPRQRFSRRLCWVPLKLFQDSFLLSSTVQYIFLPALLKKIERNPRFEFHTTILNLIVILVLSTSSQFIRLSTQLGSLQDRILLLCEESQSAWLARTRVTVPGWSNPFWYSYHATLF